MSEQYIKLANFDELKTSKLLRVDHERYCILLAYVDGDVYAVDNTCTHEDASLAKGSLHGNCVKCPLHGSRFNLKTGEAMNEPAEEKLNTYPVNINGNDILVQLA